MMRFALTYLMLKLKELYRSALYRSFAAFLLLLTLSMVLLIPKVDEQSPLTLALLNPTNTRLGQQVTDTLLQDGGYRLRPCANRRELTAMVLSGEVLCGYDFAEDADSRMVQARYAQLVTGIYREKSPATALCDEAVCGAIFRVAAPDVAQRQLAQGGLGSPEAESALRQHFLDAMEQGHPMQIELLGAQGQELPTGKSRTITDFLYALLWSLVGVFAIISAFYTNSIDHLLIAAGQKPVTLGLCSTAAYTLSYLGLLVGAHLIAALLLPPGLLLDGALWRSLLLTAVVGGVLEQLSRRFLSCAVLPLLPFLLMLAVAAQVL